MLLSLLADLSHLTNQNRSLGLTVARGTMIETVTPTKGMTEIANPFTAPAV